jgi:hypothetical protein
MPDLLILTGADCAITLFVNSRVINNEINILFISKQ